MSKYSPQLIPAIFLVAGTCIGGGMLALPVATCQTGFWPSLSMMALAWFAMTCSALCLLEAGFWIKKDDAHLSSITGKLLGAPGKALAWVLYFFICYASLVAYIAGAGHLLTKAITNFSNLPISKTTACCLFVAIFGPVIFLNHRKLGKVNGALFLIMIIVYIAIISCTIGTLKFELLQRENWSISWLALPLLLTSFSFQTIVPSLHPYLQHNVPSLRLAIIGGTTLAFIVYLTWQLVVLGNIPLNGENGLLMALQQGEPATHYFEVHTSNLIGLAAGLFAFLALTTSFFGIAMGLYDFLSDGLKIKKDKLGNIKLGVLILAPSLFFAISYERIFLLALDASGGFGDAILNGIMPVLMIWIGRYYLKYKNAPLNLFGGKKLLILLYAFYIGVLLIEIFMRSGHLKAITDIHVLDFMEPV